MTYTARGFELVAEAETRLRTLIEQAVRDGEYGDVTALAALAERVAALRTNSRPLPPRASATPPAAREALHAVPSRSKHPRRTNASRRVIRAGGDVMPPDQSGDYPRFERDGGRLIKIGWSARDRRVYEHRAPKQVVMRVAEELNARHSSGAPFKMEELLPVLSDKGEVPSYQAYLALAWLRSVNAVERQGKDGYVVKNGKLSPTGFKQLWDDVAVRR